MHPHLMVINRDQFWQVWGLLKEPVRILEAGSLWVVLALSQAQTNALAEQSIHVRSAYPQF